MKTHDNYIYEYFDKLIKNARIVGEYSGENTAYFLEHWFDSWRPLKNKIPDLDFLGHRFKKEDVDSFQKDYIYELEYNYNTILYSIKQTIDLFKNENIQPELIIISQTWSKWIFKAGIYITLDKLNSVKKVEKTIFGIKYITCEDCNFTTPMILSPQEIGIFKPIKLCE